MRLYIVPVHLETVSQNLPVTSAMSAKSSRLSHLAMSEMKSDFPRKSFKLGR
jgi:hypothetical protein